MTDGRTDRQSDRRTSCDGIVRAMRTHRAVKILKNGGRYQSLTRKTEKRLTALVMKFSEWISNGTGSMPIYVYRAMLCIVLRADYAVARWLSVCLSACLPVTRLYSMETAKHIIKLFSLSGSHTFSTPNNMAILWWRPCWRRRQMQAVWKKLRFSANVSHYLGNDTR